MIWYDKARCQWYIFNGKTIMVFTNDAYSRKGV